ncbi:hypothetical protein [Paenibacillus tyrfis]|uniref:Uncharacterized protein n=1 Tax=Paenibacillus tyrfis TaxID=1501230 RepID=A0A081NXM5_9BACL|nr:hypothetical protein [Paenibacillus tyrfis]KEQ23198.1 hypothetical protein ET33_17725 [Paenibacillus tyrfis]
MASIPAAQLPQKAFAAEELIGKSLTELDRKTVEGARQAMQELWQGKPVHIELEDKVMGENDVQFVIASNRTYKSFRRWIKSSPFV